MNTRQKGNRTRRKAVEYYESQGWKVDTVEKAGRFIVEKDLFASLGAGFDLIGIKKNLIVLIQVKTNNPPTRKKYLIFSEQYGGTNILIESYTWFDNDGYIVLRYLPTKDMVVVDEKRKTKTR
jgi:Holliday junction resolvase